nr:hypothetical protein [Tanacetum cinerariifolium]
MVYMKWAGKSGTDLSDFGYAIEDNSIHHESQYGNVFSEMNYSLNFNDMLGNYNVGEYSHGVEELDMDFINETNEENGEDSSEEETIEKVNQKIIEADIVLQKTINDDIQNKELNCIDEYFQRVRESNIHNEEQMFVKGMHEEKEEEILKQDSIEVNVLKVIEADSMAEKSTQDDIGNKYRKNEMIIINKDEDEFNVFNGKKETSFDFKMFDIPKVDDKENSVVGGFEDCLMKGLFRQVAEPNNFVRSFGNPFQISTSDMPKHILDEPPRFSLGPEFDDFSIEEINQTNLFRAESEIDVLKEDIKPDIKNASIRVQPKHKPSIAWYLKSPFKVRGSALNTYANTLSQTEVLTVDTLFIMDEEIEPIEIVYSSYLLNFNERYKSANSPSRYFFKPIPTNHLKIEDFTTHQDRLYKFEKCINLSDYDTKRMLNSDKMFHLVFFPVCTLDHFFLICFRMKTGKVVIIGNSSVDDNLTTRQRYFKFPQELISVFYEYLSKNSPQRRASIFRNVEPERMEMIWRTNENEFDSGVFLRSHMDNYFGQSESKWECGFCKESKEQTKKLKFLRSKFAARILLSENNSYKDEFQKKVDKVRSIDKNTRRKLIEKVVFRRPAKLDEYFRIMKS